MKYFKPANTFFILCFCITGALETRAQDLKNPGSYLDYIGAQYTKITQEKWDYTSAVGHGKRAKLVEKRRKELLLAINESKRTVSKMPPFNKSTALRDSVVSYLQLSYLLINEDYAKIVNMEEVAEQSYDLMEAYFLAKQLAVEKAAKASDMLAAEEDRFIAENHINIIKGNESKLSKKMREASAVFDYYNKVYLIFFKAHKQNDYLIDALNKGDINSMEQNRNALLNYSKDGLDKIKEYVRFAGDETLSTACRGVLSYYVDKAQNKVPSQIEYFTIKDKFDKIKTSFDNIKPTDRTQQNIDLYNNAIKEINAASQKYNTVNTNLSDAGNKVIDNWNKKSDSFLNNHIP